ncbi:hypothetical protein ACLMJK_002273 [Lecanora helva]
MDWMGDGYSNEDCKAVVQRFFFVEVAKHKTQEFEFLSPGAEKKTSKPVMRTPRRYTVGRCTLAIVMLDFFDDRTLPGRGSWAPAFASDTDVASFNDLWLTADLIEACCMVNEHHPGWAIAGTYDSIGVFIWTAGSYEDRLVPPGVPTFSTTSNVTAIA